MKKLISIAIISGIILSMAGCSLAILSDENDDREETSIREDSKESGETTEEIEETSSNFKTENSDQATQTEEIYFEKDFGSFSIPEDWEESVNHSGNGKFFYIPEGNDDKEWTDNISVRTGTNRYTIEEAKDFANAITAQLNEQFQNEPNVTIYGSGTSTEKDYLLISFDLTGLTNGTSIAFYYILADNKYCEVYLTYKDDPEAAKNAALTIVNSFIWEEDL
ncbi:MAG: hypothetical protein GXY06_09360 [Clostridiaceae bacterium]|nr:hypothetical protein [Clostridiaceae bacterium]